MPAGSYLTTRSFSYRKLKKLPPDDAITASPRQEQDQQQQQQAAAASIQAYYRSYYRALGAAVTARRRSPWRGRLGATTRAWGRRRKPRLRISRLARALRRRAAAVGGRVRASVARVAARLREGRPYVGDLFAGNYMFMQVAPSPTMAGLDGGHKGFAPFTEYYYGKVKSRPPAGTMVLQPAAAAGVQLDRA